MPQHVSSTPLSTRAFAKRASVSLRTLRFYDSQGLLGPSRRSQGGQRLYSDADLIGLVHIRALQFLTFSLTDIARALREAPQGGRAKLAWYTRSLQLRREQLSHLLTALERAENMLGRGDSDWCGVVRPLQTLQLEQRRRWLEGSPAEQTVSPSEALPPTRPAETVDSLRHPLAESVAQLLTRSGRQAQGRILIDDEENIRAAQEAGIELEAVCSVGEIDPSALVSARLSPETARYRVARRTGKKLFGSERESRVFALARTPRAPELGSFARLPQDIVVLEDVRLAGNVGAIVRSARALGLGGVVLLGETPPEIYDRRLIRASRGAIFGLPVVSATVAEFLGFLSLSGRGLVVSSPRAHTAVEHLSRVRQRLALAFGHEKEGCSPALTRAAQYRVGIPMARGSDSLNVSVAAGIVLYARAQRWGLTAA